MNQINNFGILRLVAATFVICSHSFALVGQNQPSFIGISLGTFGVFIFFVISGFLLSETSDFSWRYFWKRGLRVFPGLVVLILLCTFVLGPAVTTLSLREYFNNSQIWTCLSYATLFWGYPALPGVFATNPIPSNINGSLWMMPPLLMMYILLFAYAKLGILRNLYALFILYLIAWPIVMLEYTLPYHWLIYSNPISLEIYNRTFHLSDFWIFYLFFFGGVMLSLGKKSIKFNQCITYSLLVMVVIAYLINCKWIIYLIFPYIIVALAQIKNKILNSIARKRDISYGLFIIAWPIQQTLVNFLPHLSVLGLFVTSITTSTGLALLLWRFIEMPALSLKNYDFKNKFINFDVKKR